MYPKDIRPRVIVSTILIWCVVFVCVFTGTFWVLLRMGVENKVVEGNEQQAKMEADILKNQGDIKESQKKMQAVLDSRTPLIERIWKNHAENAKKIEELEKRINELEKK